MSRGTERARSARAAGRGPRVAYVLKMFPRLSETFVLNEILELERQGATVSVHSLKKPDEGRFHPAVSRLRAPVRYAAEFKLASIWAGLKGSPLLAGRTRERLGSAIAFLLALDVSEPWQRLAEAIDLAERALAGRVEHFHAHFATSATEVAMIASAITGIPYSFTAHAKDIYRETVSPALFSEKVRRARFAVTVTDAGATFIRRKLLRGDASLGAKVRLLYNGIDLDWFSPAPPPSASGADAAGPPLVLSTGRLVEKKGFPVLLDACGLLARRRVPFRCEIAGDGEEREALERRARRLGLDGNVAFLGALTHDAVRERLRAASVVALPCVVGADGNRDSLPTVLLEGLACGLPVVSTRVGGIGEIVDTGKNGYLVAPGDAGALARAIEKVLDDPARAKRLGAAAREKALARFDLAANVATLRAWFEGRPGADARGSSRAASPRARRERAS